MRFKEWVGWMNLQWSAEGCTCRMTWVDKSTLYSVLYSLNIWSSMDCEDYWEHRAQGSVSM